MHPVSRTTIVGRVGCGLVLALALTACTGEDADPGPTSAGPTSTSTSAAPGPDDASAEPDGPSPTAAPSTTAPVPPDTVGTAPRRQPDGTPGDLTAVDVATDSTADTVTFTFDGTGLPPYEIGYQDVVMRGEDDPLLLDGTAAMTVTFTDASPGARGVTGKDVITNETFDQPVVRQVVLARNLGGTVVFGLGLAEQVPFSVEEDREGGTLTLVLQH